ncbi:MAG: hypothetical protein KF865_08790 [Bdellovibrionaceae bacterium]|nr:hypothetical protein [Pseudobdellovibrionaceae bacterium]
MSFAAIPNQKLCRGIVPENDRWIGVDEIRISSISRAQFDSVLDRIQALYAQEVSQNGAFLKIERFWSDGTVNAYASQDGRKWTISMYGGMARHPALTPDGFALVACHEMGHHLGGAPKINDVRDRWASNEGQSDYYGSLKCMRRFFANDDNEKIVGRLKVDAEASRRCARNHASRKEQLMCLRTTMAAMSLGAVLADLNSVPLPKLTTPDKRKVNEMYESHPRAQCRLDTYFQGALCPVPVSAALSPIDYRPGTCADEGRYRDGLRPFCWFKTP